jgi:hypothetical protein
MGLSPERREYYNKFLRTLNKDQQKGWKDHLEKGIAANKMTWCVPKWKEMLEILLVVIEETKEPQSSIIPNLFNAGK